MDEEKLVQTVKPLVQDASSILQKCKSTVRALDPDSSIAASAKVHTSSDEATPDEYQLADLLKILTQNVSTTMESGRCQIANMPRAKKKLNQMWSLLSDALFQIFSAVCLLLSGVLGPVNNILRELELGEPVHGLLGGLGLDQLARL